jgi:hypothetical protein
MDQNLIVLILVLISIIVAFYAAYLALTAHRKLNKVQVELKKNISLLNESIALNQNIPNSAEHNMPIEEEYVREPETTMLNDLDQFPSLEEIAQANLEPLGNDVKNGIDNLEQNEMVEESQLRNDELMQELIIEEEHNIVETEEVASELLEEVASEIEVEEVASEIEVAEEEVAEEVAEEEVAEEEVAEEEVAEVAEIAEEVVSKIEESEPVESEIVELDNIDLEMAEMETVLEENTEETVQIQEIKINSDNVQELPKLEDLTEEILNKFQDKQIKEICRRENIRIKGTKREKIERILKFKEYQVQI